MSFLTPVWSYVDALVHPTAQHDALTAARHRVFIAPRLLGSFAALASFPGYLALRGVPSALEVGVFSWLVAPILIVYYLSRTGRYESAHVLSSLSLTGLALLVALCTGGIGSFAAVWLLVVPLEAALSASRRIVALAAIFALSAAGLLLVLGAARLLPQPVTSPEHQSTLAAIGIVSATLYATGLALGVALLARTSVSLLQVEEDRHCLLAHAMTDVIVRHGRNGSVLSVSPAAEALIGVQANRLLGNGVFDKVHVADRPAYLTAIADAATLNEERSVELRIRRGAGVQYAGQFAWIEMRCRPRDPVANEREVVAVLRDISERKSQEHAIEIARLESERASVAKSHFVATMSHELRTPLNAIIGLSDMLTHESLELGPGRRSEYAKLINDSGRHLLLVVNGILDVSKMETGNFEITPQQFAPAPEIESCTDLLALKAEEAGVELSMRLGPDLPEVTADRRAFRQILINLISNAVKFTPHGGRVMVSALRDGPKLAVTVEDTGIGIGDTDLSRVGEAFFQARASYDRNHDGSGLRLSIVKGLVHLHGGEVDIQSHLGEGTRVTVRLPLECEGGRSESDPVKLVTNRNRSFPMVANVRVKKSA
ncbi:MAG TPA: ATP-binding protein [Pseudolabrys sp.]|nr:ATP-binding protein [Pseudolabrys sp.]